MWSWHSLGVSVVVFKEVYWERLNLVELVLLAKFDALLPAVVALEQVCCDSPELNEFVLLKTLS